MASKPEKEFPPEKLVLYEAIVATIPEIPRRGDTVPYTSFNGNMFSYLNAEGMMAMRMPPGDREAFLTKYGTKLFEAYGIIQKEYVTVPDSLLANTVELRPYFSASYEYCKSLKPKPTKKSK